jgi:S1-C subfamily serine protease
MDLPEPAGMVAAHPAAARDLPGALTTGRYPARMPRLGPPRDPPYPGAPPPARRRPPRWLTASLIPAVIGGAVALGGAALTGNLGGSETVIARDPTPLPVSLPAAAAARAEQPRATAPAGPATGVQGVVAQASPAVVKVTAGSGAGERLGSGFLVDARGRILTNAHVLGSAKSATVTFDDGTEERADVLGRDESTDLAVLRVASVPGGVRALALGRSGGLVVGDPVIAIGNPFGLERTATTGIVSALKRIISAPNDFDIQNVIQTDAAINQGNSGGPLLDARGRVVGINSQIASESGGNDGIGFAIPIDTIRPVADSIIATGTARHSWLGVTGRTVTPAIAKALGAPDVRGVAVVEVDKRGPAAKAGLEPSTSAPGADVPRGGDLIVAVGGRPVEDMADVSRAVSAQPVGGDLDLTILRDGRRETVKLVLADRPADVGVTPQP